MKKEPAAARQKTSAKRTPARRASSSAANLLKVLSVTGKINSTLNLDELLGILMNTAAEVMGTDAASLMLIDEAAQELVFRVALGEKGRELTEKFRLKLGEGIAGYVAQSGMPLVVNDPLKDPRFARRFDKATGFSTAAILCVPMKTEGRVIGVLQAINPLNRKGFRKSDLELFEIFADQAALAVEKARMHGELVRQEKARQELAIAHTIQQNFLPDLTRQDLEVEIAAQSLPALTVGGDFYDVVSLGPHQISMVIGDVSGKGVPAALYMVRAISEYRFLAAQDIHPAKLLEALNNRLCQHTSFGMFVTLFCLIVDLSERKIYHSSAGHHPLLFRTAATGETIYLEDKGGIPLGMMPESAYDEGEHSLASGDCFLLYTDGLVEARNRSGEEYGSERLLSFWSRPHTGAVEATEKTLEEFRLFTNGAPQHDDTTLLTVRIP